MKTINIEIKKASNKRFNNKKATFCNDSGLIKIGRTSYIADFGSHQPNKDNGDFKLVDCTIHDSRPFTIYKEGASRHMGGGCILEYSIT